MPEKPYRDLDCIRQLGSISANAAPVYLNIDNISVAVGPGTTATTSNNTFDNGQTIDKVIDAPSATAEEFHNQTTHIWFSGGTLELLFDFGNQYDLTTLHFWNYTAENFDVDSINFTFFDASNTEVGNLLVLPELGTSPGITAQDYVLAAPLNVQFVTAVLAGSNNMESGCIKLRIADWSAFLDREKAEREVIRHTQRLHEVIAEAQSMVSSETLQEMQGGAVAP